MIKKLILISILLSSSTIFADTSIENNIKKLVMLNLQYSQDENMKNVMSTMHSQSPSYLPTKNTLPGVFENYDLSYKLKTYKFIAYDGDLAYARFKQITKKISGLAFNNNEMDVVQTYRKESGKWKIWSQMNIDIKYIE